MQLIKLRAGYNGTISNVRESGGEEGIKTCSSAIASRSLICPGFSSISDDPAPSIELSNSR